MSIVKNGIGGAGIAAALMVSLALAPRMAQAEDVAHYAVSGRIDPATEQIQARVDIDLPPADAHQDLTFILGKRFSLDPVQAGPGATVTVTATDKPLPDLQKIVIHYETLQARPVHLRFRYRGPLNADSESIVSAERIELNLEEAWLPVREDLGLLFSADLDITGWLKGTVLVSQGDFRQQGDRFIVHRAIPDFDIPLAGAAHLKKSTSPDLEFYAADVDDPLVALLHKHALGAGDFYRRLYGPHEGPPMRMVIVPRAASGGYGYRGLVVMPTFRKPGDPVPAFDQSSPARFVAHEFSHAWLRSPTPEGGGSYWIAESVAEYLALRYVEATFGHEEFVAMVERKRKSSTDVGPLVIDEGRPKGKALYGKGPLLLLKLEAEIGRPALDRIIGVPDRPLTTRQFLTALKAIAGEDVAARFAADLHKEGPIEP